MAGEGKVYVLLHWPPHGPPEDGPDPIGAYSTEAGAEAAKVAHDADQRARYGTARTRHWTGDYYDIVELDLDPPPPFPHRPNPKHPGTPLTDSPHVDQG